jgi:hypothetical protein
MDEEDPMTQGFQQQDTAIGFCIPKSCATPQHGQKPDRKTAQGHAPRAVQPRPGH